MDPPRCILANLTRRSPILKKVGTFSPLLMTGMASIQSKSEALSPNDNEFWNVHYPNLHIINGVQILHLLAERPARASTGHKSRLTVMALGRLLPEPLKVHILSTGPLFPPGGT